MIANRYYNEFISRLRERVPKSGHLAPILKDILCLSRESVYRRLRGEVPFTFDEISELVRYFDISVDEILFSSGNEQSVAEEKAGKTVEEAYEELVVRFMEMAKSLRSDHNTEYTCASNIISSVFFVGYDNLLKFRLAKRVSYETNSNMVNDLSSIRVPEKVLDAHRILNEKIKSLPRLNFIWDSNIFMSMATEIEYFHRLGLLSSADLENLAREMQNLINDLESIAAKGKFTDRNEVMFYISNVHFETIHSFVERSDNRVSTLRSLNVGNSVPQSSPKLKDRNWILFIKRHSTLISNSGEVERIKFFNRQRDIVADLVERKVTADIFV